MPVMQGTYMSAKVGKQRHWAALIRLGLIYVSGEHGAVGGTINVRVDYPLGGNGQLSSGGGVQGVSRNYH